MRRIQLPVWLDSAAKPRAGAFLVLFVLEAWCRALLLTIVPLEALRLMDDAFTVSVLYFLVSAGGLAATMVIPVLVYRIRRRWAFTLGVGLLVAAMAAYASGVPWFFPVGLVCQVVAVAFFEIVINLFVLDHVPRTEITRFEPRRLLFVATPFTLGPWLGVWLADNLAPTATYALVAATAAAMLGFFWFLRMTDNPAVTAPLSKPPNPIRYLPHFFEQPRLRLAWGLAIGRTAWWVMFFVYAPIYLTDIGFSRETAALIVSGGVVPMFLAPLWGKIGRARGIRFLLSVGFSLTAVITVAIAAVGGDQMLGAALVVAAAFCATIIDGAGNVPFLRAVHPYERAEMTSVFVTFRHTAQLLTPGVFIAVLSVFSLPAVFVTGGLVCAGMAGLARYLPRKL